MSNVTFPSFLVIDGSWGPCKLAVSNSYGIAILSKQTSETLENWKWSEISHATIKKASTLLVQVKKNNGVKKLVTFLADSELERFKNVLTNAVPILKLWNIKAQRKFLIIHPIVQPIVPSASKAEKILTTDENSNVKGLASIPPPPPPPPPMVRAPVCQVPIAIVNKTAKPKQVASYDSVLKELKKRFPNGPTESSDPAESIKAEAIEQVVISTTEATANVEDTKILEELAVEMKG